MKRVPESILFFVILLLSSSSAQWKWQNPIPGGSRLTALKFVDQSKIFAVGCNSTVLKSTNAGLSWQTISAGKSGDLNDIDSYGENLIIAVGQKGLILRSSDGGATWTPKNLTVQANLAAVSILSSQLVVVVGDNRIIKSTDGGVTWSAPVTPTLAKMQDVLLVNNQTGYAVGAGLFRSTDGSATYNKVSMTINDQFVSIAEPSISAIYLASATHLYCSTDGGRNWDSTASFQNFSIKHVAFASNAEGYVIGTNGRVFHTTDAGITWENISPDSSRCMYGIAISTLGDVVVAGDNGVIYKRSGTNWITGTEASFTGGINDILFITPAVGFACGDSGCVLKTLNGGEDWTRKFMPEAVTLTHLEAPDQDHVFAFGSTSFRSLDGGLSWSKMRLPDSIAILGGNFISGTVGFACGEQGMLLKTSDGGAGWDVKVTGTAQSLNSIYFQSPSVGFCAGNGGILKTTDDGETWFSAYTSKIPLNSIAFKNDTMGIAVGGNADTAFAIQTSDGGESWNEIAGLSVKGLCVVKYLPCGAAIISGWNGAILKSTDDGATWDEMCYQTSETITGFFALDDSTFWACGKGIILTTSCGSYTRLGTAQPKNAYNLDLQNYPNPFNPSTVLTYSLPFRSKVVISVFDITGRLALYFDEGEKAAGKYQKTIDAGKLSSGVYFCTVSAGNLRVTRKIMLLK